MEDTTVRMAGMKDNAVSLFLFRKFFVFNHFFSALLSDSSLVRFDGNNTGQRSFSGVESCRQSLDTGVWRSLDCTETK